MIECIAREAAEECLECDPSGGCPNGHDCVEETCLKLLDVIEREGVTL